MLEIVPYDSARDTLSTQIDSGIGPDIVGPVGWGGSNDFYGQWLDLTAVISDNNFDTSIFDPALIKHFQTDEGQVGLPFAVYPGAMYFVPAMFDEIGLAYPPQKYGDKYALDGVEVDWNWDTVTEVAKRLTIDANGLVPPKKASIALRSYKLVTMHNGSLYSMWLHSTMALPISTAVRKKANTNPQSPMAGKGLEMVL